MLACAHQPVDAGDADDGLGPNLGAQPATSGL